MDNLAGKLAFEIWANTFRVKIKKYHANNGIFDEKTFISAPEDANHTIKFCEVGSHYQNAIVERKFEL